MADEQTPTVTIRLNVLGPLTVECEPGGSIPLPRSKRACHLLALFAVEPTYDKQQLVNYLWSPGQDVNDPNQIERKRIRGKLDKELSTARGVFGLGDDSGFLGSSGHLIVHRTTRKAVAVVSDLEEFRELADESHPPADWRAALALVRGEVAENLPTGAYIDMSWLERERKRQRKEISSILSRLHPDATTDELGDLCQDVLDGRYEARTVVSAEPAVDTAPMVPSAPAEQSSRQIDAPSDLPAKKAARLHAVADRIRWRLVLVLAVAAAVVVSGIIVWMLRPTKGPYTNPDTVPPQGAIVNAENGAVSLHTTIIPTSTPVGLDGGQFMLACIVTPNGPCHYAPTLKVHIGNILRFSVELGETREQLIPYLKLHTEQIGSPRQISRDEPINELTLSLSIQWPRIPHAPDAANFQTTSTKFQFPNSKAYTLSYIPGTTELLTENGYLLHYLPNGIMGYGIALQDVGSPPGCFRCESQYRRYVNFRAKVEIAK
jgi:hypothetical protein